MAMAEPWMRPRVRRLPTKFDNQNECTDHREGRDEALLDKDVFNHVQHGSHTFVLEREDAAAGAWHSAPGFWMADCTGVGVTSPAITAPPCSTTGSVQHPAPIRPRSATQREADAQRTGGSDDYDRAAPCCGHHVLLGGHGNDDRDVHRRPKLDPERDAVTELAVPDHPDAGRDQQDHGEADAANIGLHTEGDPEKIAEIDPDQGAEGEERDTEDRHWPTPDREDGMGAIGPEARCVCTNHVAFPSCIR